ncbi:MAG: hypothetical protein R6X02_15190 [Enhygromyxa sp.]
MRHVLIAACLLSSLACSPAADPGPVAGEACDDQGRCAEGLDCMRRVCVDDRGPAVRILLPESLQAFDGELSSILVNVSVVDLGEGDQVEVIVDPAVANPHRELVAIDGESASVTLTLPTALAPGSHHLRAQLVDADGQPYPNPSASAEVVLFVRDPEVPDTPRVAVVWPPSGYQHRIGTPLEVEVVVMPGSFGLVGEADSCAPVVDCEPELGPECEDSCGPVSRSGHAKLFTLPDYPACLFDLPISCNGQYIMSLRPGAGAELLDDHRVRGVLPGEQLTVPGTRPLQAALSFADHDPYPSRANVIYDQITIELIE